jgi:hypothetical protein
VKVSEVGKISLGLHLDERETFAEGLDPEGICQILDGTLCVGSEPGQIQRIETDGVRPSGSGRARHHEASPGTPSSTVRLPTTLQEPRYITSARRDR